jgi:hypothetical protein
MKRRRRRRVATRLIDFDRVWPAASRQVQIPTHPLDLHPWSMLASRTTSLLRLRGTTTLQSRSRLSSQGVKQGGSRLSPARPLDLPACTCGDSRHTTRDRSSSVGSLRGRWPLPLAKHSPRARRPRRRSRTRSSASGSQMSRTRSLSPSRVSTSSRAASRSAIRSPRSLSSACSASPRVARSVARLTSSLPTLVPRICLEKGEAVGPTGLASRPPHPREAAQDESAAGPESLLSATAADKLPPSCCLLAPRSGLASTCMAPILTCTSTTPRTGRSIPTRVSPLVSRPRATRIRPLNLGALS